MSSHINTSLSLTMQPYLFARVGVVVAYPLLRVTVSVRLVSLSCRGVFCGNIHDPEHQVYFDPKLK